jgi:ApbE superfamily uncharacterized protein (UPF0280 family)
MNEYKERFYRRKVRSSGLVTFEVEVKETDLSVSAEKELEKETRDLVFDARHQIESYISAHPEFLTTLNPYPPDPYAPPLVREMIECTRQIGVGPMASVAGAIAQHVGEGLLKLTPQVIVENGGDIFLKVGRPATISVFAGDSPLSGKVGIIINPEQMPLGVCSSSGTVGHSFSSGTADAGCVLASSAAFADGAATALCNMIRSRKDLSKIGDWAEKIKGVLGVVVILGDKMATWGKIELVAL